MKKAHQASESIILNGLLCLTAGLMNTYSYLYRGKVFASLQTGNLTLLGIHLSNGEFDAVGRYMIPLIFFICGVILSEIVRDFGQGKFHWRQWALVLEIILLLFVGFIPNSRNNLANLFIATACGIQVQSFRKCHGIPLATTMFIGNMRSIAENVYQWLFHHQKNSFDKGILFFYITSHYLLGAIIGSLAVHYFNQTAIWLACAILVICLLFLFNNREKNI